MPHSSFLQAFTNPVSSKYGQNQVSATATIVVKSKAWQILNENRDVEGREISNVRSENLVDLVERDNVKDHRAGTSDHLFQVARKTRLRVHRIVICRSNSILSIVLCRILLV